MRRHAPILALVAILAIAIPASATPKSKLQTFGTGVVTINGSDAATLVNGADEYSGVYLRGIRKSAKPIEAVHFSFNYDGTLAGGAPRFSIPIDTNHNHSNEGYAFVDALNCGASGTSGTGTVSTDDANCKVFFQDESFDNWDAFVDAHAGYRIPPGGIPFIIADQPGTYVITDIDLR
jgi:hypothetical protein